MAFGPRRGPEIPDGQREGYLHMIMSFIGCIKRGSIGYDLPCPARASADRNRC